jgi:flagellin-like protein
MIKSTSKGITPVIAIVLLLLITVAGVGVVYTQFNELTQNNQAQDQLQNQQRVQTASLSIVGVNNIGSSGGSLNVSIRNTGDETVSLNQLGAQVYIGPNGADPVAANVITDGCSLPDSLTAGSQTGCTLTISDSSNNLANDGVATTVEIRLQDTVKDSYSCNWDGSSSFC